MMFSLIMPVYNVADYLCESLDSVISQTYADWEAICIDDGSTDGSGKTLDKYRNIDDRIKVFHKGNEGVGAARNVALLKAVGRYVLFLDADDVLRCDALQRINEIIQRYPKCDLVKFGYINSEFASDLCAGHSEVSISSHDISKGLSFDEYFAFLWQFAYKREILNTLFFPRYVRGEDRVFLSHVMFERTNSYIEIDDALYFYRKRSGSAMNTKVSAAVLKDELSHRLDIIEVIDRSGKRASYAGIDNFETFCIRHYINFVRSSGYSEIEQHDLINWFYHELPRIQQACGFTANGHLIASAYGSFRCRFGRHVLSTIIPKMITFFRLISKPALLLNVIKHTR